jgi:RecB family exonuclease
MRGALGFYERAEVKDQIALLRLLRRPDDRVALVRLARRPPFGLSDHDLKTLALAPDPYAALAASSEHGKAWTAGVREVQQLVGSLGVDDLFFELMERTRHLESLVAAAGTEADRVAANVSKFAELIAGFCARSGDHSLAAFLERLELVLLSGAGEELAEPEPRGGEAVQVMTIHQAKGLEFEVVFVPSLVEGRLPQAVWRDGYELPAEVLEPSIRAREDHVADERRLLYVAMTRARSRLVLSWARRYEGSRVWEPSRFLDEIARANDAVDWSARVDVAPAPAQSVPALHASAPNGGDGDGLVLSFTAAAAYRDCPRQYWYRHVLRLPLEQTPEGRLGTAVHQALMRAGERRRDGKPVTERTLRELYRRAWGAARCSDDRRGPALEAVGWAQLKSYLAAGGLAARPSLVEHAFTADLDGWRLRGIIDRVDPPPSQKGWGGGKKSGRNSTNGHGDGSGVDAWRLVDYKTGAPMPAARLRRDLQLALYALGAREALALDPLELEIVYLRTGKSVVLPADPALLDQARQIGDEVAAGVRAGRFEARPERRRCQLCPYRLACVDAL